MHPLLQRTQRCDLLYSRQPRLTFVRRWMFDVGCSTLDVGRWMLGVGRWMLEAQSSSSTLNSPTLNHAAPSPPAFDLRDPCGLCVSLLLNAIPLSLYGNQKRGSHQAGKGKGS